MSFLESLAKGFIRSSVNQIGRDTGRVISNNLFGDSHSSPVRIGSRRNYQRQSYVIRDQDVIYLKNSDGSRLVINEEDLNEVFIRSNFYPMPVYGNQFGGHLLKGIASIIIPILGPLIWVKKGYEAFSKKMVDYRAIEILPFYVEDRRFNEGIRREGEVEQILKFKVPITHERSKFNQKGIYSICLALIVAIIQWGLYVHFYQG